jgi:hypothetical protein
MSKSRHDEAEAAKSNLSRFLRPVPLSSSAFFVRTGERTTVELSIVTESEKTLLLAAVKFIYSSTKEMKAPDRQEPSFTNRLDYLRRVLPPVITGQRPANP